MYIVLFDLTLETHLLLQAKEEEAAGLASCSVGVSSSRSHWMISL